MKTKFICMLSAVALLASCSNDELNQNNRETSSLSSPATSSMLQKVTDVDVDAPFQSCTYEDLGNDTYAVTFTVPDNYTYTITESNGVYLVDLTRTDSKDSTTYTMHYEEFEAIDKILEVNFKVNGVMGVRPKITVTSL